MALAPGTRLGPYEITALIGAGGMGEVYRATDTTLKRAVAIKVLRDGLADSRQLARLQREAEILASLNHPNIAAIYGLEQRGDTTALVLELVEGPTLADRIAQRPIALQDALGIAKQIAEALEAAHEQGIVHRDLKPANIKVRVDGTVKVLDFGLARTAVQYEAPGSAASPTMSADLTIAGTIVGTPAYMSPEQVRGQPLDRRTDIWAFGCVVYEMIAGRPPFQAPTIPDTLACILDREPDWTILPPSTPSGLRTLLRRCLEKSPQQRLPHVSAARLEIEDSRDREAALADRRPVARAVGRVSLARAVVVAGLTLIAGAVWLAYRATSIDEGSRPGVARVSINPSPGESWVIGPHDPDFAITRDGARIAYIGRRADGDHLIVRRLDAFDGASLGRFGAIRHPFFSPDGRWVGFVDGNLLKRVSVDGGAAVTIAALPSYMTGASWGPDNVILFGTLGDGLFRVLSAGGEPEPVPTALTDEGVYARWPEILPDARGVLFASVTQRTGTADIRARSLSSGEETLVVKGATFPRYARTGHLLYVADNVQWAVRFDPARLATIGDAVPVVPGVMIKGPRQTGLGAANIGIADNGTLVYRPGAPADTGTTTLVWVDREGREEPLALGAANYGRMRLSPDGSKLAVEITDASGKNTHVWVGAVGGATLSPLTLGPGSHQNPVWTHDGQRVIFQSITDDGAGFRWMAADGSSAGELIARSNGTPYFLTPDGRSLVYTRRVEGAFPLFALSLRDPTSQERVAVSSAPVATISPNGRWLASSSAETGDFEIYVQPYPNPTGAVWRVTTGGGRDPAWSRDGRELFYQHETTTFAVAIATEPTFAFGPAAPLFDGPYVDSTGRYYDIAPDGRFLMIKPGWLSAGHDAPLHVVLNWFDELQRLAPEQTLGR